jgi:hypothetical protein
MKKVSKEEFKEIASVFTNENDKKICDACGKVLQRHKSEKWQFSSDGGLTIGRPFPESVGYDLIDKALGKYKKSSYFICFECWLESMGVKP